jgi:aryl-phospho-beta-D-glucosidase BglC (GH1 family)
VDTRFQPLAIDCKKSVQVIVHPMTEIRDVRLGVGGGIDLTRFLSSGTQSMTECSVTLNWNHELYGAFQPQPNQVLEVRLQGKTLWVGIIETISQYKVSRGVRSMEVSARTRETLSKWKQPKIVTKHYPAQTSLTSIATDIGRYMGLQEDEIVLASSPLATAHSNTQMAGISAWEMLNTLLLATGQTPFIDGLGRLRTASRDVRTTPANFALPQNRILDVTASRVRPPVTRVRVEWLDPVLKKSYQTGRRLGDVTIGTGWFIPYLQKEIWFSSDKTQRAENTYLKIVQSANSLFIPVCDENYSQTSEFTGEIQLTNFAPVLGLGALIASITASHAVPDSVALLATIPVGRLLEATAHIAMLLTISAVGTGVYEVWGNPFEWVHARNTTEAFDQNSPLFIDNPTDIESNFIVNEDHAQAVAIRELIYKASEANEWSTTIVDDPRIEYGDILKFPDGSRIYVTDYTRPLGRESDVTLQVKGFLLVSGSATLPSPTPTPDPTPTPAAPAWTTSTTLPAMQAGDAFSLQLVAANTTSFALTSGAFPAGVTMSTAGLVSGTPTSAGAVSFTVTATGTGGTTPRTFAGTVAAAPAVTLRPLSTNGAHIVDPDGNTVRLKGVNWHGTEGGNHMPHVLWGRNYKSIIDQIKSMGFNCIRLPLSADINGSTMPQSLATYFNPDLNGLTTLQLLIKVVDYAGSVGVYVFLDCHRLTSGAGTDSAISSDTLSSIVSFWQLMATTFKDHPAVCGADLYNEPYTVDWPTLAGFYSTIGNAIHAIAPNWLIICEGDTNYNGVSYWWGGQLAGAASNPVSLTLPNKLVYSAHDYAHSVGQQQWLKSTSNPNVDNWPDNLPAIWDAAWGYLVKNGTAPVIIGEFGGKFGWDTSGNVDVSQPDAAYEKQWLAQLIAYMNTNGVSATYWTFTSQSGDTGGLLQGDDLTPQSGKLTLLQGFLS